MTPEELAAIRVVVDWDAQSKILRCDKYSAEKGVSPPQEKAAMTDAERTVRKEMRRWELLTNDEIAPRVLALLIANQEAMRERAAMLEEDHAATCEDERMTWTEDEDAARECAVER